MAGNRTRASSRFRSKSVRNKAGNVRAVSIILSFAGKVRQRCSFPGVAIYVLGPPGRLTLHAMFMDLLLLLVLF